MRPHESPLQKQSPISTTSVSDSPKVTSLGERGERPGFMRRHHFALTGIGFASPFVIGFLVLYLYPIVASGFYSFTALQS